MQNSNNDIYSSVLAGKNKSWPMWIMFTFFVMVFLVGVGLLYRFWLNPWITAVRADYGLDANVPGVRETDQDKDGLNLEIESKLGTSDNLRDTDNDGLDDAEEIKLGTDPLVIDTDRDGYKDGVEVKSKHNPLGQG